MALGPQFDFVYSPPEMGAAYHTVSADLGEGSAELKWDSKQIRNIEVPEQFQRQGVATSLWNEAQRLSSDNSKIPAPKHSSDRTDSGDAWARSVGGKLPRRKTDG